MTRSTCASCWASYASTREDVVKILLLSLLAMATLLRAERASTATTCQIVQLAKLPVTMSGTQPLVPAKINGTEVMFIADSGAFFSFLTPAAANDLKLRLGPTPVWLNVQGANGSVDVRLTTVRELTLANTPLRGIEFLVGGSEVGSGAAGLLGQNVLRLADVEYDLANGAIRLMRTKDCKGVPLSYWERTGVRSELEIQPTTAREPHTIGTAYLNGTKLRVLFDTGASVSVVTRKAAERAGVDLKAKGVTDGGFEVGQGRKVFRTWIVPVSSFKIGDEEIRNTKLRIADTALLDEDMLVGADFFLSHRIYVANERHRVFFTYNGGPVFDLSAGHAYDIVPAATTDPGPAPPGAAGGDGASPADAAGFARRGAAYLAREQYDRAIADLTQATVLAPDEASYQYELGLALYRNRQPLPALAALDAALKLKPDDPRFLEARASVRLYGGDGAGARADADAADKLLPRDGDLRRALSSTYLALGAYEQAIQQLDQWLATHAHDAGTSSALNQRCWARALWNHDMQAALADCNEALKRNSKAAAIFDSRGLVRLRLGDYAGAISDYDAALVINPGIAWSLYGRGLAKRKLGRSDEAKPDLEAALAIDRDIVKTATKVGVVP
jgi:predicted aspartyl protease/Flp pilus assembly protein TadD